MRAPHGLAIGRSPSEASDFAERRFRFDSGSASRHPTRPRCSDFERYRPCCASASLSRCGSASTASCSSRNTEVQGVSVASIPVAAGTLETQHELLPPCRLFTFETDQPGEIALTKDELVEVVSQDDGGEFRQPYTLADEVLIVFFIALRMVVDQERSARGMGAIEREPALRRRRI